MKNFSKRFSAVAFTAILPLGLLAGTANAETRGSHADQQINPEGICSQEIDKAPDQDKNAEKVSKMTSSQEFRSVASNIDSTPESLALDVADYFTEEEVDTLIISGLESKDTSPKEKSLISTKIKPFDLKCNKARAGWALYQAQGFLVCAPATVVNPLAGAVCNIAKAAGGGAIDFNKLCK